jgi:hypothetical protein
VLDTDWELSTVETLLGVSKKTDKPIKPRKPKKKTEKTEPKKNRINRLKNQKKIPVQFGFGFQSLKPIEPNRTELVQPDQHLKKKTTINRMPFLTLSQLCSLHCLNKKVATPPPFSMHLSLPLPFLSAYLPSFSLCISPF